jgi:hypothetical protein
MLFSAPIQTASTGRPPRIYKVKMSNDPLLLLLLLRLLLIFILSSSSSIEL